MSIFICAAAVFCVMRFIPYAKMADHLETSNTDDQESAEQTPVRNELVSSRTLPMCTLGRPEHSLHARSVRGAVTPESKVVADHCPLCGFRSYQVETAVRFLNNPKLQGSSLSSRKEFLKKKGL